MIPPVGLILQSLNSSASSCIFLVYLRLALEENIGGADYETNISLLHDLGSSLLERLVLITTYVIYSPEYFSVEWINLNAEDIGSIPTNQTTK